MIYHAFYSEITRSTLQFPNSQLQAVGKTNCVTMTAKVSSGNIKNLSIGHEWVFGTVATPTNLQDQNNLE